MPTLETVYLDGWVLRFSNGYTRCANSVNPLCPGSRPFEDDLREAEEFYRRHGQRVVFKLTRDSLPDGLDSALAQRGYAHEAPTAVQTLDLSAQPPAALGALTHRQIAGADHSFSAQRRELVSLVTSWLKDN